MVGPPMEEAADTPESPLKGIQDQSEPLLYSICLPTSADWWVLGFPKQGLRRNSALFLENFHMLVSIPAYLQLFKDVLSVLHVFDIRHYSILES